MAGAWEIAGGTDQGLPDVARFLETLAALDRHPVPEARALFDPDRELFVTRAPGRLDLMGGIADYSGSLVLQWPVREATRVALQRDPERRLRVVSLGGEASGRGLACEMPLDDFLAGGEPVPYETACQRFRRSPATAWAAYALGCFLVLMRERGVRFPEGARLLVESDVPEGKGVSSSAALEVAVMSAIAAAFRLDVAPEKLALLCQRVENAVVGAPCGVMDQLTAACGEAGQLLELLCQPAELRGVFSLPAELAVWGLDSGVRHAVSGAEYGDVRVGAFMGLAIITAEEGGPPGGYLANLTPARFEERGRALLPEHLSGREFLQRYGGTMDTATTVDPKRIYPVRQPAAHPVYEHFRARAFAELLRVPASERRGELLGELMYQSHAGYSACGLGSEATDLLVRLVREAGPECGLYGAKITGGGSGGTVAILGRHGSETAVAAVARRYEAETGHRPHCFAGSSPGAARFGCLRLRPGARLTAPRDTGIMG